MKNDIENRADIDDLMNRFYARALADETIGYFFTDVVKMELEHHLQIIGDFWETLLLGTGSYRKHGRSPLQVHVQVHGELHQKSSLTPKHFCRWLELFRESVDESFAGERAGFIKSRAEAIGNRMLNFMSGVPEISADLIKPGARHNS